MNKHVNLKPSVISYIYIYTIYHLSYIIYVSYKIIDHWSFQFEWNYYPPNLHRLIYLWNINNSNTPSNTFALNPNMSLNHLDETIKRSLSRSYSSNCILPIFSLDPCSLVFTSYCHILQSVFCLFFPRSLCPGVYLIPQFSQAICLPECWGGGESTQEAPKWSSKGVRCLFFGHATAPFSSKTPALSCSPGNQGWHLKGESVSHMDEEERGSQGEADWSRTSIPSNWDSKEEQCTPENVFHLYLHQSPSPDHPHFSCYPLSTAHLWCWRRRRHPESGDLFAPSKEWRPSPEASTFPRRTSSFIKWAERRKADKGDTLGICQVLSSQVPQLTCFQEWVGEPDKVLSSLLPPPSYFIFQIWFILCWTTAHGCTQLLLLLWTPLCPQTKVRTSNISRRTSEITLKASPCTINISFPLHHHQWH